MKPILYGYIKCSTTRDAMKLLKEKNIEFDFVDVKEKSIPKKKIKELVDRSGLDIKKFFNTSGLVYRKLQLRDKLDLMNDAEKIDLLSEHGMLLKRVIYDDGQQILVGPLKEESFQ